MTVQSVTANLVRPSSSLPRVERSKAEEGRESVRVCKRERRERAR